MGQEQLRGWWIIHPLIRGNSYPSHARKVPEQFPGCEYIMGLDVGCALVYCFPGGRLIYDKYIVEAINRGGYALSTGVL